MSFFKASLIACVLVLFSSSAFALEPVYKGRFSQVAINGYDPVAYFTLGAAFKGKKKFQYEWKGAKWRFMSEEHLNKFISDPEAYEPQFGGYCAYAVGKGETASTDPRQFTIHQNKLYLNYNNATKIKWEDDRDNLIDSANQIWPKLLVE